MKDIIKPAVILFLITAVAGAILGAVESITAPAIEEQTRITQAVAMQGAYPDAESFEPIEGAELSGTVVSVNKAMQGGEVVGYVVNVQPGGFGGAVDTMVGIKKDGSEMTGLNVLAHSETPGLGAKAKEPAFYEQFSGKTKLPLKVTKTGSPADDEIQAITGATITSTAVTDGANEAYDWVIKNGGAN